MKEKILITGYNGSLAKRLVHFLNDNYSLVFLSSSKKSVNNKDVFYWNIEEGYIDESALIGCQHVIHLSGYNIINRWSKKNIHKMRTSRVDASNLLFEKCKSLNQNIKTFIGASAMGYYGLGVEKDVDENHPAGNDWLAKLVVDWESASNQFVKLGTRVINLRKMNITNVNIDTMSAIAALSVGCPGTRTGSAEVRRQVRKRSSG